MLRADCVLSAHTAQDRERAEATVLQWFEELALEVEYGSADHWIAWVDGGLADAPEAAALSVEVHLYPLAGAGTQVRWRFRGADPGAERCLLRELADALRRRLVEEPGWGLDLWRWDQGPWDPAAGEPR